MKKIILIQLILLTHTTGFTQLNAIFEKDTLVFERNKQSASVNYIQATITNINPPAGPGNNINFVIDPAGTTMPSNAFTFAACTITATTGISQIECPVTILRGENPSATPLYISIQMSYTNSAMVARNIVLKFVNPKKKEADDNAKDDMEVNLLIGSNLDFFNSVKLKDLAGEFNIFIPRIFNIPGFKDGDDHRINIGANLGIYNYRNFSVDSPGVVQSMNYKLTPFDQLDPSKKIVKATYSTSGKSTKDFRGFYIEPVFSLARTENRSKRLYLSLHFEILRREEKIEYDNPSFIWRDTVSFDPTRDFAVKDHPDIIQKSPSLTTHSSYYGIGFPVTVSKKFYELFFAPTWGVTQYTEAQYITKIGTIYGKKETGMFYLCKFFFKEKVSILGLTIGGEVRGVIGKLNPYLNAYVASRISLNDLGQFFNLKKP